MGVQGRLHLVIADFAAEIRQHAMRLLWSSALFRWMSFRVRESPHPWAFFFEFDASYVVLSLCFPSCQGVTTDEVFVPSCSCQDANVVFTERVDLKCVASTVL